MIQKTKCLRCGKEWFPRYEGRPSLCPRCRTPKWDVPINPNEPGAKRTKYKLSKLTRDENGRFKRINL
jgi:hypothetical protein